MGEVLSVSSVGFVTARRVVPVGAPIRLLSAMTGGARGFWARGSRWVAHGGVLAELTAPADAHRIRTIARAARSWSYDAVPPEADDPGAEALRFYGGFSFREDHRPDGEWAAFPAALFHLPRVEYDGEGHGPARLRVREPVGSDPDGARERAEAEADRLTSILQGVDPVEPPRGASVAAAVEAGQRESWLEAVDTTLSAIEAGRLSKAVLARILDVVLEARLDPVGVVEALWSQHEATHAFLFEPVPGAQLVGAAPEALATLRDGVVTATAVAGSTRRGADAAEDARLARALLASEKDRAEHRVVVEDMVTRLEPLAGPVSAQPEPHVLALARIQHLETEIEAPAPEGRSVLELVEALHPTPAVCGVPRDDALAFLRRAEPFHRGWYAGPVGWFDNRGEGHFVPALRTAVGDGRRWRLFAGAGIVQGSDPASEWEETAIKFVPVLRALAACGADLPGVIP